MRVSSSVPFKMSCCGRCIRIEMAGGGGRRVCMVACAEWQLLVMRRKRNIIVGIWSGILRTLEEIWIRKRTHGKAFELVRVGLLWQVVAWIRGPQTFLLVDKGLNITKALAFRLDAVSADLDHEQVRDAIETRGNIPTGFSSPHLIRRFRHARNMSVWRRSEACCKLERMGLTQTSSLGPPFSRLFPCRFILHGLIWPAFRFFHINEVVIF